MLRDPRFPIPHGFPPGPRFEILVPFPWEVYFFCLWLQGPGGGEGAVGQPIEQLKRTDQVGTVPTVQC